MEDKKGLAIIIGQGEPKGEEMESEGDSGSTYENHIIPSGGLYDDVEVGESITASITGKVVEKDGKKCLEVESVDGEPVESMGEEEPEMTDEEAEAGAVESSKNLRQKLGEMNKGKSQMYE